MITDRINAINLRIHQIFMEASDETKARIFIDELDTG
jgi:SpoVK/Ycf46/Vps4 family AAA+-type ATPase